MGSTNYGTQEIYFKYTSDITASYLNKWIDPLSRKGIVSGGGLTIVSGNNITIAPFRVILKTSTNETVHVNTTTDISFTLAEATPYVTCQFSWLNSKTNYMDITAKAIGDITDNDVIIGMGVYVATILNSFDYSEKHIASLSSISQNDLGYIGIGLTNQTYQLQLSTDSAAKPSTNVWTISSDKRIKKDVKPFTDGLSIIKKFKPIYYHYNGKAGMPNESENDPYHVSIIANDLLEVYPDAVGKHLVKLNPEDTELTELYNYNGHNVTFLLINAVKELSERLEKLEKKK